MKILFTCDSMNNGGAERVISSLANEFVTSGNEVSILMISYSVEESFYILDKRVNLVSLVKDYSKKVKPIKRITILRKKIKEINPDIVISFLPHIIIYTRFALMNTKYKLIVSERNDPSQYNKLFKFLLKRSFKKADGCVFQTEDAMNWYKNYRKANIILNPVNLTFTPNQFPTERKKVIFTVGRLVKQKNQKLLIDAFEAFHKINSEYILKIYGDGPLQEELQNYINCKMANSFIELAGPSKTWHRDEYDATAFVLSSDFEGIPNALEEALCLGIPCVSTDCPVGGPKELKKLFPNLKLIERGNKKEFVDALSYICAEEKSTINFKNVLRTLSVEYISKIWLNFIKEVANV